jgi:hypothetical protein
MKRTPIATGIARNDRYLDCHHDALVTFVTIVEMNHHFGSAAGVGFDYQELD